MSNNNSVVKIEGRIMAVKGNQALLYVQGRQVTIDASGRSYMPGQSYKVEVSRFIEKANSVFSRK